MHTCVGLGIRRKISYISRPERVGARGEKSHPAVAYPIAYPITFTALTRSEYRVGHLGTWVAEKDRVSRGLVQRLRVSGTWSDGRVLI